MKILKTKISDVIIIEPILYEDDRGYLFESFNQINFAKKICDINFVQDNQSKSSKGVLRGLHFQRPPYAQSKLLRCIEGAVLDVAVDIRAGSKTFKNYISVELSAENKRQLFVPKGFAHGFVVLSDSAVVSYKIDNYYSPQHEDGIIWDDSDLGIDWKIKHNEIKLSEKDRNLLSLKNIINPF